MLSTATISSKVTCNLLSTTRCSRCVLPRGHASLYTTFDPYKFKEPAFSAVAVRQINPNFEQDAIAVKIGKNIGMDLHDAKSCYIVTNDLIIEPIYEDIAAHHETPVARVVDPDTRWLALTRSAPGYSYSMEHPEWYTCARSIPPPRKIF